MMKFSFIKEKLNTVVTTMIFLGVIMVFTVVSLLTPDKTFSFTENRVLAQMPKFSVEGFFEGEFTADYEEYITDQFFGRDRWINVKTRTELLLGKKDINGVYIGKDEYLIETHDSIDEVKAYANADRMVNFVKEQAGILGAEHVSMMVVPTASAIMADKLPAYATTFDQKSYIDYMKAQAGDNFVDVSSVLSEHAVAGEEIYYRTDHHWTTYGAYLSYVKWANDIGFEPYPMESFDVNTVSEDFLGTVYSKINYSTVTDKLQLFEINEDISYSVDINMGHKKMDSLYEKEHLDTKDKYSVFLDGNNSIVTIDVNGGRADGETLLVIKDSYAHCFVPFVANHYKQVIVIDMRYLKMPVEKVIADYGITDILVLYNVIHFAEDTNFALLGNY